MDSQDGSTTDVEFTFTTGPNKKGILRIFSGKFLREIARLIVFPAWSLQRVPRSESRTKRGGPRISR